MTIPEDNGYDEVIIGIFDEECFMIMQDTETIFISATQLQALAKILYEGNLDQV